MWFDVKQGFPGEKMFWLAVLRRSIFDFVLYKGMRARSIDWKKANQYLFGNQKNEVGLSFDEVCCLFGWEPDYIRRLTRTLSRSDVRKLEARKFKDELSESFISSAESSIQQSSRWKPSSLFSLANFWRPGFLGTRHVRFLSHVPSIHWGHAA